MELINSFINNSKTQYNFDRDRYEDNINRKIRMEKSDFFTNILQNPNKLEPFPMDSYMNIFEKQYTQDI